MSPSGGRWETGNVQIGSVGGVHVGAVVVGAVVVGAVVGAVGVGNANRAGLFCWSLCSKTMQKLILTMITLVVQL